MRELTARDYNDILEVVDICNRQVDPIIKWKNTLRSLQPLFAATNGSFVPTNCSGELTKFEPSKAIMNNISNCQRELYISYYWKRDPHLPVVLRSKAQVLKTTQIMNCRDWHKSEYYNDYFRPQNQDKKLIICLRNGDLLLGIITLSREQSIGDFSSNELTKAKFLQRHLSTSLYNSQLISGDITCCRLLKLLDKSNVVGKIVVDREFKIVYLNEIAKQYVNDIACYYPISLLDNSVASSLPYCIYEDVLKLFNSECPCDYENTIYCGDREMYKINYCKISENKYNEYVLIYFNKIFINIETLCTKTFELKKATNREKEIIRLIAKGMTSKEIANLLFISKNTVDSHTKNIYKKLGVRNRVGLIKQLELL